MKNDPKSFGVLMIRGPNLNELRKVITSDVHAPYDLLTPKELRAHPCLVDRVDITVKPSHQEKKFFRARGHFRTFFQKIFFDVQ